MIKIEVLGFGCKACNKTYLLIDQCAQELGIELDLHKVADPQQFVRYQVLTPPGIVMNDQLIFQGSCPSKETIVQWLSEGI